MTMLHVLRFLPILCLLAAIPGVATGNPLLDAIRGKKEPELLTAEQAFTVSAAAVAPDRLQVTWRIEPGHYLYREKFQFELSDTEAQVAAIRLPEGKSKDDPYFGPTEIYHDEVNAEILLDRPADGPLSLTAQYQGCAERGICYQPISKQFTLTPATADAAR